MRSLPAFSLAEVTLALGIAGFCLIAVFGLYAHWRADKPQRHFSNESHEHHGCRYSRSASHSNSKHNLVAILYSYSHGRLIDNIIFR